MKKFARDIIILPKITIIWYIVHEIRSEPDWIFCHFGSFLALLPLFAPPSIDPENKNFEEKKKKPWRYYHFTNAYQKWQSYDVWFLRYGEQRKEFFIIFDRFLSFYKKTIWKIKILKKSKKKPGDIIILHKCTINDNYMMCVFWDMEQGGHIFLSFWTIFWPFASLKSRKIKILKKLKKRLEMSSLYTNVPKIMTKCYTVPVIRCVTDAILILYLRLFLPFYPPNNPKNQNF